MVQKVGRGTALLFHERGTSRGCVVSSTPRQHFTPRKDPVPILQEAGWAPGPVWTGGKSRPHRDLIPDRPARSQSLYRLSYPAHNDLYCSPNTVRVIKSRKMRWVGHVALLGRGEAYTGFWWGNLREIDHLEDSGRDGTIILRWIFRKWDVGVWIRSMWLRIGTGGGHL